MVEHPLCYGLGFPFFVHKSTFELVLRCRDDNNYKKKRKKKKKKTGERKNENKIISILYTNQLRSSLGIARVHVETIVLF